MTSEGERSEPSEEASGEERPESSEGERSESSKKASGEEQTASSEGERSEPSERAGGAKRRHASSEDDRRESSPLEDAFDEPAFIPYLAAGDPDFDASIEYVEALARGGADVIELGLPFSEPIAEGPTIQRAIVRALEGGMTPDRFFEFADALDVDVPLVCMTYYNLIYQYGEKPCRSFVERAAEVGIQGFVVPDLPAEEADLLREICNEYGLDLIFIIAPTTTDERLEQIMKQVSGYVYVQARLGVTGARSDLSDHTEATLARLKEYDIPKAVGFGISSGEHAESVVAAGADGAIVGSALVDIVAEGDETDESTDAVAAKLESLARELKAGALAGGQDHPRPERT